MPSPPPPCKQSGSLPDDLSTLTFHTNPQTGEERACFPDSHRTRIVYSLFAECYDAEDDVEQSERSVKDGCNDGGGCAASSSSCLPPPADCEANKDNISVGELLRMTRNLLAQLRCRLSRVIDIQPHPVHKDLAADRPFALWVLRRDVDELIGVIDRALANGRASSDDTKTRSCVVYSMLCTIVQAASVFDMLPTTTQ